MKKPGEAKSVVKIYLQDRKLFGVIVKLLNKNKEEPEPIYDKCDKDDQRFNPKTLGMTIITDMDLDKDNNQWKDGEILDPENGKVYDCKLWIEEGKLQVRDYILFFHRTQEWLRYDGEI